MAYIEREVERSVPELKIGNLLNDKEIRQIIKERTFFADRKFKFSKHEFLRYIQFENKLFRLLMLRSQSKKNLDKNDINSIRKQFIQRINSIYNIALNRYSNDKQLWLLSFDFAKRYSERISRAKFLKALLLHPHWINAWIEAAKYEFEWNKNPTNARLLFQRAIALNKKSISLYLAFFAMEISVIKKHLFYESGTEQTNKDFDWKKELKNVESQSKDEWLQRIYAQMEVPKLIFRFCMKNIDGKDRYVMIKKIFLLIPSKGELKTESGNDSEGIMQRFNELSQYMFEYLEKHFYFDSVIIQLLARKNLQIYSKNNTVLNRSVEMTGAQVFERAILLLENGKTHKKQNVNESIVCILKGFIEYLQKRMDFYIGIKEKISLKKESDLNESELYLLKLYSDIMNYLVLRLLHSFQKLMALNATNAQMFRDWVLCLTQISKFEQSLDIIRLATKEYSNSVCLWKLYSDLYCRKLSICESETEKNTFYKKAIAANMKGIAFVSNSEKELLWMNICDIMIAKLADLCMSNNMNESETIMDSDSDSDIEMETQNLRQKQCTAIHNAFRKGIEQCLSHNNRLKESYLKWMAVQCSNCDKQIEVLQWFDKNTIQCSMQIYKIIFDIYESILLFEVGNRNNSIDKMERLYEKCLNEHGRNNAQVWIWCVEFMRKYRKMCVASSMYQRAIKTLDSEGLQMFLQNVNMK